jgi:hypothetical protein
LDFFLRHEREGQVGGRQRRKERGFRGAGRESLLLTAGREGGGRSTKMNLIIRVSVLLFGLFEKNPPKCSNSMNPTRNERPAIINYRLR